MATKTIYVTKDSRCSIHEFWSRKPNFDKVNRVWFLKNERKNEWRSFVFCDACEYLISFKLRGGPKSIRKLTLKVEKV